MEAPDLNTNDKAVARAVDSNKGEADDLVRLSSGVVLKAKQANPNILIRIMTASPRPKPPVYMNVQMGREMENPDHPDYIEQVKAWEMSYNNGMLNALVALGTEVYSIPKKFPKPEDNNWIEDYKALGLPANPNSEAWRYITWVLFKAAPLDTDTKLIMEKVKSFSGVKEADVRDAEMFSDGDKAERVSEGVSH